MSTLWRNTSKGTGSTSARRPEVRSNESRARRAKGRGTEKVPDETGDVTIDGSDREGKREGREDRSKETRDMKD